MEWRIWGFQAVSLLVNMFCFFGNANSFFQQQHQLSQKKLYFGALGLFCILAHISSSCTQIIACFFFEHLFSCSSIHLQTHRLAVFRKSSPRVKGSSHSVLKNLPWDRETMSKSISVLNTCQSVSCFILTTHIHRERPFSSLLCISKYTAIVKI